MIFYKDDLHEDQTNMLLRRFGLNNVYSDIEYGTFCYVVSATYKAEQIKECIDDENNIDLDILFERTSVYSNSEKDMINFGLQCFNKSISEITLADTMRSLDDNNKKVVKQAIEIRY